MNYCNYHLFTVYTTAIIVTYIVYTYTSFYQLTLRSLRNDELTTLEPDTRSRISARFMAPGHEPPRARRGTAPRAESRSPRPFGDVCAKPLRFEGLPETRGVPSSGVEPSQNGTFSGDGIGRRSRAGRSVMIIFGSRGPESVQHQSVCTEGSNWFGRV